MGARQIRSRLRIEPRFHQTDMMGVVHNAEYFLWFEEGRLRIVERVLSFAEALRMGIALPVIRNTCEYRKAVRYGDALVLTTTHDIQDAYEGVLRFRHSLVHERTKEEMAHGQTDVTLLDMTSGRLVRSWPAELWERYRGLGNAEAGEDD